MTWFASPLPGYLSDRFGCRITNFIGGALCVTGLAMTLFSHSLNLIYFTHSLVFGLGVCFTFNCSYLVIAQYFKEKLSMATGIVALGTSVGVLFTGPLLQVLLDSFDWRGTYRVAAAYFTIICILSLTYDQMYKKQRRLSSSITMRILREATEVTFLSTVACGRFLRLLHPSCVLCLGVLECTFHTSIWLVFLRFLHVFPIKVKTGKLNYCVTSPLDQPY